ncbi:hypothetical protein L683_25105 [Pseudomonas aeruginosa WC55]|jgi:hypothetical protein|nr:hypothetical protein L683_25105 [Pseudomonas aeruginosa WC55]KJS74259.1 MAG: hypothetical protein JL55_23820 [[Pseudomonas] sp. BICA1-14]
MTDLSPWAQLFPGIGLPMSGSSMSDEEALSYARQRFPHGSFCLIRNWLWLDLDAPTEILQNLAVSKRQPAIIYADTVVYDSERRWDVGDFVRTSPLHHFADDFLFRTLNTAYLLLGPGQRKRTSIENVACII